EQGIELAGVPDDALASRCAEKRDKKEFKVAPAQKGFGERLRGSHAGGRQLSKDRGFLHLQADVERDADENKGEKERNAPAPIGKLLLGHGVLSTQDDKQGYEEAERGGDLDEAGVEAALSVWHVFRDVDGRSAVLAAESEALKDANQK